MDQEENSYSPIVQEISYNRGMDAVRQLIVKEAAQQGKALSDLSKAAGKNHAYLQQFVKRGIPRKLPEEVRHKLADLLGVSEARLRSSGDANVVQEVYPVGETEPILNRLGPYDLPILGITMGGRPDNRGPDFWMNGEQVGVARRPRVLEGSKTAFALYVDGTSMIPAYSSTDIVAVDRRPAAPGDDVVIELKPQSPGDEGNNPSFLKRLVSRKGKTLVVEQFNPAKKLSFNIDEIQNLFRVVPRNELLG